MRMAEWRNRGYVADSDDEDESQISNSLNATDARYPEDVAIQNSNHEPHQEDAALPRFTLGDSGQQSAGEVEDRAERLLTLSSQEVHGVNVSAVDNNTRADSPSLVGHDGVNRFPSTTDGVDSKSHDIDELQLEYRPPVLANSISAGKRARSDMLPSIEPLTHPDYRTIPSLSLGLHPSPKPSSFSEDHNSNQMDLTQVGVLWDFLPALLTINYRRPTRRVLTMP